MLLFVTPALAGGSHAATCAAIARDIEALREAHPQLARFSAKDSADDPCAIRYAYRVHRPTTTGGWTAAFDAPDPDGVHFYLHVYDPADPAAASQIDTQPVMPRWTLDGWRVTWLILEGADTTPVNDAILAILRRHGLE
jgi:hypothetical protein